MRDLYQCISCARNFYQPHFNNCTSCHKCTQCGPGQMTIETCTDVSDTVCASPPPPTTTEAPSPTTGTPHGKHSTTSPHSAKTITSMSTVETSSSLPVTSPKLENATDAQESVAPLYQSNDGDKVAIWTMSGLFVTAVLIIIALLLYICWLKNEIGKKLNRRNVEENGNVPGRYAMQDFLCNGNQDDEGQPFIQGRIGSGPRQDGSDAGLERGHYDELSQEERPEDSSQDCPSQQGVNQHSCHNDDQRLQPHQDPSAVDEVPSSQPEPIYAQVDKNRDKAPGVSIADETNGPTSRSLRSQADGESSPETHPNSSSRKPDKSMFSQGIKKLLPQCAPKRTKKLDVMQPGEDIPLVDQENSEKDGNSGRANAGGAVHLEEETKKNKGRDSGASDGTNHRTPSSVSKEEAKHGEINSGPVTKATNDTLSSKTGSGSPEGKGEHPHTATNTTVHLATHQTTSEVNSDTDGKRNGLDHVKEGSSTQESGAATEKDHRKSSANPSSNPNGATVGPVGDDLEPEPHGSTGSLQGETIVTDSGQNSPASLSVDPSSGTVQEGDSGHPESGFIQDDTLPTEDDQKLASGQNCSCGGSSSDPGCRCHGAHMGGSEGESRNESKDLGRDTANVTRNNHKKSLPVVRSFSSGAAASASTGSTEEQSQSDTANDHHSTQEASQPDSSTNAAVDEKASPESEQQGDRDQGRTSEEVVQEINSSQPVSDKFLQRLSDKISFPDVKKLCREFDLAQHHIDDITGHYQSPEERKIEMLLKVKKQMGASLTYAAVLEHLNTIGNKNAADQLVEKFNIRLETKLS